MPRYFFHVYDGREMLDQIGYEFATLGDVRDEAIKGAGEMVRNHCAQRSREPWSMKVIDDHGIMVCELMFSVR